LLLILIYKSLIFERVGNSSIIFDHRSLSWQANLSNYCYEEAQIPAAIVVCQKELDGWHFSKNGTSYI